MSDFTYPDTFATSHVSLAACGAGNAANEAEHKKKIKYSNLGDQYLFIPLAVEKSGSFGSAAMLFIKELGKRIRENTGEIIKSYFYLVQKLVNGYRKRQCFCCAGDFLTWGMLVMSILYWIVFGYFSFQLHLIL